MLGQVVYNSDFQGILSPSNDKPTLDLWYLGQPHNEVQAITRDARMLHTKVVVLVGGGDVEFPA